jgi:hypothetical protein
MVRLHGNKFAVQRSEGGSSALKKLRGSLTAEGEREGEGGGIAPSKALIPSILILYR